MTSLIYQELCGKSKRDSPQRPLQYLPQMVHYTMRSRISLLRTHSFLRNHGFYSWLIKESRAESADSQTTFCLGFGFPAWLRIPWISLALVFITVFLKHEWRIQWSLRVQRRVSVQSPLMKACAGGDVALMRQLLNSGQGSIDDRTMCLGRTPLLVSSFVVWTAELKPMLTTVGCH